MGQCGKCHGKLAESYFETYHGKVSKLGYLKTAKCYDCHGAHDILPVRDPRSHLCRANIVKTCAQVPPRLEPAFRRLPDARDAPRPEEVPVLFWAFWGMTGAAGRHVPVAGVHTRVAAALASQYRPELAPARAGSRASTCGASRSSTATCTSW